VDNQTLAILLPSYFLDLIFFINGSFSANNKVSTNNKQDCR